MPGLSEQGHQFVKAGAFLYGDDVRAGNGNVVHCMFAKMEEIFEHLALNRRQIAIAGDSAVLFLIIFVDGVFQLLAKGMFALVTEKQGSQSPPYSSAFATVRLFLAGVAPVVSHFCVRSEERRLGTECVSTCCSR